MDQLPQIVWLILILAAAAPFWRACYRAGAEFPKQRPLHFSGEQFFYFNTPRTLGNGDSLTINWSRMTPATVKGLLLQ